MKESERQYIDNTNQLQLENEDLIAALRDTESKIRSHQITIDELNKKLLVSDEQDFQQWLESIIFSDDTNENDTSIIENNNSNNSNNDGVVELISSLLNQWKDQVGSYPTTKGRIISKAEQKFLQRITDLVLGSNERCTSAQAKYRWADTRRTKAELQLKVTKSKLKSCIEHLHRYRKRALAAENIINVDKKHTIMDKEHLLSYYHRLLNEERSKYGMNSQILIAERRDRKLVDAKLVLAQTEAKKLQLKVAELESRGNATLRGRDEAISSLESRLGVSEESLRRWIRVELPRLVSGFPVTEDFMASDEYGVMDGTGNIAAKLAASLGLDKTFALAQALCAAKAAQTVQDMRLTGILEKNSILKERNMELEGIINKWKCNFETSRAFTNGEEDLQRIQEKYYVDAERESNLSEQVVSMKSKLLTIEEENIELRGRLTNTNSSVDEMKKLIDIFLKEEKDIKNRASSLITKMRISLENEHANELRLLREAYEAEKNLLTSELERVASAVEEARILSADNLWKEDYGNTPNSINKTGNYQSPQNQNHDHHQNGNGNAGSNSNKDGAKDGAKKKDYDDYDSRNYGDDDNNDDDDDDDRNNRKRMKSQINDLQRQLDLERSRYQQAHDDIRELENLLTIQRQAFEQKPSHQANISHTATSTPSKIQQDDGDNNIVGNDSHSKIKNNDNDDEDADDHSLWPSLGSLVDELGATLKSISNKHRTLSSDTLLKTAIAMTARVARIAKATPNANTSSSFNNLRRFSDDHDDDMNSSAPGVIQSLQSLASRVKFMETDITDNNTASNNNQPVPERHLFLLRDLRARVMEIEEGVPKEIERIKDNARFEKNNVARELEQRTEELHELKRGQEATIASITSRYEESLKNSQDTLEEQTSLFNQQITMLEELLNKANQQCHVLQKEIEEREKERISGKSHREEILKMQTLIDQTNNEYDNYRKKYTSLQQAYDRDLNDMRESFNRYKKAQDIVVQSLESQIQNTGSTININTTSNVNDTSIEFEEKYRKLEYRFKAKSLELDAVMKALARNGNSFEEDSVTNVSSVIDLSVPPPNPRSPSRTNNSTMYPNINDSGIISNVTLPKDIRDDLYEVKIRAAESEIDALTLSLTQEKHANHHLRKQIQGTLDKTSEAIVSDNNTIHTNISIEDNGESFLKETKQEFAIPDGDISKSKVQLMLKKMNDMRIRARNEIFKLNAKIQSNNNNYEELLRLRVLVSEREKVVSELKEQNHSLREENSRKIKLLNNLKSSKIVLENTLGQHYRLCFIDF